VGQTGRTVPIQLKRGPKSTALNALQRERHPAGNADICRRQAPKAEPQHLTADLQRPTEPGTHEASDKSDDGLSPSRPETG